MAVGVAVRSGVAVSVGPTVSVTVGVRVAGVGVSVVVVVDVTLGVALVGAGDADNPSDVPPIVKVALAEPRWPLAATLY